MNSEKVQCREAKRVQLQVTVFGFFPSPFRLIESVQLRLTEVNRSVEDFRKFTYVSTHPLGCQVSHIFPYVTAVASIRRQPSFGKLQKHAPKQVRKSSRGQIQFARKRFE